MHKLAYASPQTQVTGVSDTLIGLFRQGENENSVILLTVVLAVLTHVGAILLVSLIVLLLNFLGWSVMTFERPKPEEQLEFQLVNAPEEEPLNKKTRIISTQNSRAGGKRQPNKRIAQPMRAAGQKQPKAPSTPQNTQQQPAKSQPTPQKQTPAPSTPQKQPPQPPRKSPIQSTSPTQTAPKKDPSPPSTAPTQTPTPTAPKAPKPRTTTVPVSTVPTPTTSTTPSIPTKPVGGVTVPPVGGAPPSGSGKTFGGPITGGFPSTSTSGGGKPGGSPKGNGTAPGFVPGNFTKTAGTETPAGGRPGAKGPTSGDGGRDPATQSGSPQGGPGRGQVDARKSVDFGPYIRALEARIRRNWQPPEDAKSKKIEFMFTISKDGRLLSSRITRSSGFPDADRAAQLAVERSAPFPALPADYQKGSVNINFTFDYATHGRVR